MAHKVLRLSKREARVALGILLLNRQEFAGCQPRIDLLCESPFPSNCVCTLCLKLTGFLHEIEKEGPE